MDNPQQPQGPGMMQSFLKDPRNIMTALVFLAAATRPKNEGESTGGRLAQAGVAGLGFRGGLDKGIRNQKIQDDEIQARGLERSQEQENRRTQLNISQQGVNLQGQQLNQNERLAREQMANQRDLATTVRPETPEEARLKRSQANYYNRMPREGSGGSGGKSSVEQNFEEGYKQLLAAEIAQAAMENRPMDPLRILPGLSKLHQGATGIQQGLMFERRPDGVYVLKFPSGSGPGSEVVLQGAPEVPPQEAPPQEAPGVNFLQPGQAPQAPPSQRSLDAAEVANKRSVSKRGGGPPSEAQIENTAITKLTDEQLRSYLRDPRLKKEQAITIRNELRTRDVNKRGMNSSSPGLR